MAWRYFAQRYGRDGAGEMLDLDLPLLDPSITWELSAPDGLSATIPVEIGRLRDESGRPLLREWGTAIFAEEDDQIRAGYLLTHSDFDEGQWSLEGVGFAGYLNGMPYDDSTYFVEADPLDIVRHIWEHVQTKRSPLGLIIDDTTSPVRIGTELEQVEFDSQAGPVSFEAGPKKLAWWMTHDLSKEIDDFAKDTPFDWSEEHAWNDDRTAIEHRLRIFYPGKGQRREDLRFIFGENVDVPPSITRDGAEYANAVLGLGAGEGRDMVRSPIIIDPNDDVLERVAVVADKTIKNIPDVSKAARRELARRLRFDDLGDVTIQDHSNAPFGSFSVGDEILLQVDTGWIAVEQWYRVLSITITPDSGNDMAVTLQRTDKDIS